MIDMAENGTKTGERENVECGDSSPLSPAGDSSPANARELAQSESAENSAHSKDAPAKDWPHAPVHRLSENGVYFVTAGTLHKIRLFDTSEKLSLLENLLLSLANKYLWHLKAWAVLANHYHFVARGNPGSANLKKLLTHLHANSARDLNRLDNATGRTVWCNFRDTKLTFEKSYLARLNYVHQNAVKHGLVSVANQYRWCSAAWFERTAAPAQMKTIYSYKIDKLEVDDDF
jgi:putative transposase